VQNVDYNSSKDDMKEHFKDCGKINRITILYDKWTSEAKG